MTIVSIQFLVFLLAVLIVYYVVPKKAQWIVLLVSSYCFYLFSGIKPLIFVISTTLTVYAAGRKMQTINSQSESKKIAKKKKRKVLLAVILFNFGILLLLKYWNFAATNFNSLFTVFNWDIKAPLVNIVLPLGISFYTFQAIGYSIDIYRNKIKAEQNLAKFALFISFFPQVMQGPISRYDQLATQFTQPHKINYENLAYGAQLMLWGFFKKMIIADRLAISVDQVFGDYAAYDGTQTLIAMFFYAVQIYADFSGGIDIIRGAAQMMGIDMIENFRRPYFGKTVAEYWRRWHMSLTNWMRDYVFFPLTLGKTSAKIGKWGRQHLKNEIGKQLPSYIPTFVTFFLIGIWHGAGWGFMAFGLYNAVVIVLGMVFTPLFKRMNKFFGIDTEAFGWKVWQIIRTFSIMCIGKCITRADSVGDAFAMIGKAFHPFEFDDLLGRLLDMGLDEGNWIVLTISLILFFAVSVIQENEINVRDSISRQILPIRWFIFLAGFAAVLIFGVYGPGYNAADFIYRGF